MNMNIRLQLCHCAMREREPVTSNDVERLSSRPGHRPYVSTVIRKTLALLMLIPALASAGETASIPLDDFYITVTANDIYLCGEGFGGIYGCIDEAISREAKSVVISASTEASVHGVHALIKAVHAIGFDKVGFATLVESDA
jgi:hypothetical protein